MVAQLTFVGTAGETQQFTVATLDDAVWENTEKFTVTLQASNPLVTDTDTATGMITDNEIGFLLTGTPVVAGRTLFTVFGATPGALVDFVVGTKEGPGQVKVKKQTPVDVNILDPKVVAQAVADANGQAVAIINLFRYADRTIYLQAFEQQPRRQISNLLTIAVPPLPQLNIADQDVDENAGSITFTVELTAASDREVQVNYATANGIARSRNDYTGKRGRLRIPAGQLSGQIIVPIRNDGKHEDLEVFYVSLSRPRNSTLGQSRAQGTIRDDDPPPPQLSIANVIVDENENAGQAVFWVTLSWASHEEIRVNYATANGTARSRYDYTGKQGTLQISAGQLRGQIIVPIKNDGKHEDQEVFYVNLSRPKNATLADNQASGRICDDDPAALRLAATPGRGAAAGTLTAEQLATVTDEAIRRWASAVGDQAADGLSAVNWELADLPGNLLGLTSAGTVRIDRDAAGRGWFVDSSPWDDEEFLQSRAGAHWKPAAAVRPRIGPTC